MPVGVGDLFANDFHCVIVIENKQELQGDDK